jgi:pyruvate dehydrogenase complex dihydrolipoamide acetyltransferase long form
VLSVGEDSPDIKIGQLIAVMVEEGQDWKDVEIPAQTSASEESVTSSSTLTTAAAAASTPTNGSKASDLISPSVRNLLHQYGIEKTQIGATGPHNILLKGDVLAFIDQNRLQPKSAEEQLQPHPTSAAPSSPVSSAVSQTASSTPSPTSTSGYVDIEISNMRRTIAKRLTESKTTIPHAYMAVDCNVNAVIAYRKQLKSQKINVSVNDIIIKAAALALRRTPALNATYDSSKDQVIPSQTVDISIAVATPNGLITPIVKQANHLSITDINAQVRQLADKARDGKLQPNEFIGGSFSISNLGMFGISEFSAVINPPQAAILAIGSPKPIVKSMDNVVHQLTCTLSYDARVADEEQVAQFLELFKEYLEMPAELDKQDGSTHRRLAAFA